MKRLVLVLALGVFCAACGEKASEMKKSIDAVQQMASKAEEAPKTMDEAQKFYEERVAKGDTVAMPYKDLQQFLPSSVSGFKAEGEPSGAQQSMGGYSMSNATQNWVSESGDGSRIVVTINDWGGTSGAYTMASAPFAMGFNAEDDHQRTETIKLDVPYTNGFVKYDKDSKNSSIIAGTRYRYLINVELSGGKDDQTKMVTGLATDVAKKLEGK